MKADPKKLALRRLPPVDGILQSSRAAPLIERHSRPYLVSALRKTLDGIRKDIAKEPQKWQAASDKDIEDAIFSRADVYLRPDLRKVVNATGVIVHTNLGRAPLAPEAVDAMVNAARGYSNLEYDLEAGARGSRQSLIEDKLCELTGAQAAIVVNNNAGAVMLALMALASGRQAVVSRGELVEIGGSFRIPDVMAASGAFMVEVGTTNKTHLKDYQKAVSDRTAVLLKVHRSNFFIGGFTLEVSVEELAALAKKRKLTLMVDLGSGSLVDTADYGLKHEPTPRETLRHGAHVVTFSGDKLLGGPQAGIIAGKRKTIAAIRSHPVHRALRPDKLTLAALEATLRMYMQDRQSEIPVIAMMAARPDQLRKRAAALRKGMEEALEKAAPGRYGIESIETSARIGGGALADAQLPSWGLAIRCNGRSPRWIVEKLRSGDTPVIARIERDKIVMDVRTLHGVSNRELIDVVVKALASDTSLDRETTSRR